MSSCGGSGEEGGHKYGGGAARDAEPRTEEGGDAGSELDDPYAERSGSRIEIRYERAEGGARSYRQLYDRVLGVACLPTTTGEVENGERVQRCMPQAAGYGWVFADATCSDPLVAIDTRCNPLGPAPIVARSEGKDCSVRTVYSELGEALSVGSPGFVRDYADKCVARSATDSASLYRVGPPLDWSRFARIYLRKRALPDGKFTLGFLESDDGLRKRVSRYVGDEYCSLMRVNGSHFCLPGWVSIGDNKIYASNQCSGELLSRVYVDTCSQQYNRYLGEFLGAQEQNCGDLKGLYRLGRELSMGYVMNGNICAQASVADKLFARGEEVDVSAYGKFERRMRGQARIVESQVVSADGVVIDVDALFDTELNQRCAPFSTVDGIRRCLPGTTMDTMQTEFSDAACSAPLVKSGGVRCRSAAQAKYFVRRRQPPQGSCSNAEWLAEEVVKTEPYSGALFHRAPGGTCVSYQPLSLEVDAYWKPLETLPLSRFVSLSE